jgi:acyl dehydratase
MDSCAGGGYHANVYARKNYGGNTMGELATRQALYFEDYNIGDTATTMGRTVTETDIVNFAA